MPGASVKGRRARAPPRKSEEPEAALGGSWVGISRVLHPLIGFMALVTLLISRTFSYPEGLFRILVDAAPVEASEFRPWALGFPVTVSPRMLNVGVGFGVSGA